MNSIFSKTTTLFTASGLTFLAVITCTAAFAQDNGKPTVQKSNTQSKKVEVSEKEGIKTVTITTIDNDNASIEVISGDEANDYLQEHGVALNNEDSLNEVRIEKKIERVLTEGLADEERKIAQAQTIVIRSNGDETEREELDKMLADLRQNKTNEAHVEVYEYRTEHSTGTSENSVQSFSAFSNKKKSTIDAEIELERKGKVELQLVSEGGEVLEEKKFIGDSVLHTSFDMKKREKGTYKLILKQGGFQIAQKVVVE
ncbi:MAG: hypothetical protein CL843_20005 [Crocinitomicaceae bacterium]|nr:hypothetical protein [Crocinitomicaceae bacterium]MAX82449.1 hypothetical protein [Crocinitomicaceae bacterium]|tara:strand:- start:142 stop:912 length:771 start_codon:yes stop_codon:yes gene_type:complete